MRSPVHPVALGPGQGSVWDYPRPPRVEATTERIRVRSGGETIMDTTDAVQVLEASHPPVYYLPRSTYPEDALEKAPGASFCEFKGTAK